MMKRKSHNKSRRGCQNCKRRHVKCDEQGPPCLNCSVREAASSCVYSNVSQASLASSNFRNEATLSSASSDSATLVGSTSPVPSGSPLHAPPESTASSYELHPSSQPQQQLPLTYAPADEARRLMSIELMHRWSTVTYKTFCALAEDVQYMQIDIPLEAFRNEAVLNGLLALTAIEKAMTESVEGTVELTHPRQIDHSVSLLNAGGNRGSNNNSSSNSSKKVYIHAAMEYYDQAISALREQLANLGPENQHTLYFASLAAAMIHLLMPQCMRSLEEGGDESAPEVCGGVGMGQEPAPHSAVAHALSLFELLNGCTSIVGISWDGMLNSPAGASIAAALSHGPPSVDKIDADTDAALKRLMVLAAATGPPVPEPETAGEGQGDGGGGRSRQLMAPAEVLMSDMNFASLTDGGISGPLREPRPSDVVETRQAELAGEAPARTDAELRRDMYKNSVYFLRYCFAEGQRAVYKFSGVGFPMMGGREFAGAVARREPLALLIVAYWGVMMGLESNSAWWTGQIGAELVAEISEALVLLEMRGRLGDGFSAMPEWRASISWARTKVGLTAL